MGLTPHRIPAILPKLFSGLVWRMQDDPKEKNIYLTFDDGPVPGPTEFVLDQLKNYSIKATFFCIGDNVRKHPEVLKKVLFDGHSIGNHTFNHLKGWSTSNKAYLENIRHCDEELTKSGCLSTKLFRPPYGRIRRNQIKALGDYKIIMWDVLSLDYQQNSNPERLLRGTIEATRPGSIVVLHDSGKSERNLKFILPRYVEYLAEAGFQFKPLL